MDRPKTKLALVIVAGLLAEAWASFGPYVLSNELDSSYINPFNSTFTFGAGLLWVLVLALTYRRDPRGRMWKLVLLFAIAGTTWTLGFVRNDFAYTAYEFFGPLSSAVLIHVVLAFPNGTLKDRFDRVLVTLGYFIVLPLQLLGFLFLDFGFQCAPTEFCPVNVLHVFDNQDVVAVLSYTGAVAPVLGVVLIGELLRHWRRASPALRRAYAPVVFGMPLVIAISAVWWLLPVLDRDDIRVWMIQNKVFDAPAYLTPTLFLIGFARARFARTSVVDLAIEIGRGVPLGGLRAALARTLRDPTVELAFPAPSGEGCVDSSGNTVESDPGTGRQVTRIERDGEVLALLIHDPAIDREDPGLVEAVGSVAGMALANERLSAQVRAQLEEVRASRTRIIEAADAERRRVERDLHDGAQQRLVALVMRLELARASATGAAALIDETTTELQTAIAEVRGLARGIHPTILTESGLRAAVEALAERTPLPVEIDVPEVRYPPTVEATAYYVIAEALTNVVRYSGASTATVRAIDDGVRLTVTVRDNGRGGADPAHGTGLRGLLDRVAAAGGSLTLDSPREAGTVLTATLPVA